MAAPRGFEDRVVAVTGGGSGIGLALAERFARAGARVALLDRDGAATVAAAEALGERARAGVCDVSDPAMVREALEEVQGAWGGIDVLVNNAGISHRSRLEDTRSEVFRRVMEVNFFGALHCTQAALPSLIERRGLIVVISSVAGFAPLLGRSGYCASKHALHGLFDTLRCELRERGVDVLLACPGFTATGIEAHALGADGAPSRRAQSRVGGQARPEAVADAIFEAARRRRRLLVLSRVGRLTRLLTRVAPGLYERQMTRALRVELAPPGA